MKIAILLGDGMAGEPLADMGNKTSLEIAKTPNMDKLSAEGTLGLAVTVPEGYPAGSDVANLSVFGFNPADCYTGRAPIEAAAMGIELAPDDVAYRMNLVTLLAGRGQIYMQDFTADHISNEEGAAVVATLAKELAEEGLEFYPGVSYRNLLVWRGGEFEAETTPPHDITGMAIHAHLPKGPGAEKLIDLITSSQMLLKNHPVNIKRREEDRIEVNSIWLWGQGKPPQTGSYADKYNLTGTVISAVDLLKGIGALAGLKAPHIEGATGYLDTNYQGKVDAAIEGLKEGDFVYLHVEAPDETAHQGFADKKIEAIEDFDTKVVGPMMEYLAGCGEDYAILVMPDHPTPVATRTHSSDPVPFALFTSNVKGKGGKGFTEAHAKKTGVFVKHAHNLMDHITGKVKLW